MITWPLVAPIPVAIPAASGEMTPSAARRSSYVDVPSTEPCIRMTRSRLAPVLFDSHVKMNVMATTDTVREPAS